MLQELAGMVRARTVSARELVERALRAHRASRRRPERRRRSARRGGARRGGRRRRRRRPRRAPRPARRRAPARQGGPRRRGDADHAGLPRVRRRRAGDARLPAHRAPAARRRDRRRQDEHPRVLLRGLHREPALRRHPQPVGSRLVAGRLQRRLRRRHGRRHGAASRRPATAAARSASPPPSAASPASSRRTVSSLATGCPSWMDFTTDGPIGDDDRRPAPAALGRGRAGGRATRPPSRPASVDLAPGQALPRRVFAAPRFADWGPLPAVVADLFADALQALEADLGLPVEPLEPGEVLRVRQHRRRLDRHGGGRAGARDGARVDRGQRRAAASRLPRRHALRPRRDVRGLPRRAPPPLRLRARARRAARRPTRVIVTPTMAVEGFPADGVLLGRGPPRHAVRRPTTPRRRT